MIPKHLLSRQAIVENFSAKMAKLWLVAGGWWLVPMTSHQPLATNPRPRRSSMPDNFEWKTEEDGQWEEELAPATTPQPRRRLPWRNLLIILFVLVGITAVIRSQINQQVTAATADVEAEVIAAHNFLQHTAWQGDVDLLKGIISGRDPEWADTQKELVAEGWFAAPPFLGWTAEPPRLATASNVTITLSPDLRAAELQITNTYKTVNSEGVTETVALLQTAVYRRGTDRWLLAPPEAAFWGEWVTEEGEYVTLTYPQRDEAIAQKLLPDLDALVKTICHDLDGLSCNRYSFRKHVRLEKEATRLLHIEPEATLLPGSTQYLPAPSLLGLPVDETSYQALYRAYGVQVGAAVITELTDYDCCRWAILYQGLLDRQLHQLGLKPWPLAEAAYNDLFHSTNISTGLQFLLVRSTPLTGTEQMRLYAFVEFLEQLITPELSLFALQVDLDESNGIITWLNQYAPQTFDRDSVEDVFYQYIYSRTTAGQMETPPIAYPAPQIQLLCNGYGEAKAASGGSITFYQYDLAGQQWHEAFHYEPPGPNSWAYAQRVEGLPDRYWITSQPFGEASETHYALLEQGQITASFSRNTGGNHYFPRNSDPNGRYLTLNLWQERDAPAVTLLDLEACRRGVCQPKPIDGELFWSDDGRHTLIQPSVVWNWQTVEPEEWPLLALGDEQGRVLQQLGRGRWPFWLDNQTYAFQRVNATGEVELVSAVIGEAEPRPLLTSTDLQAALPTENQENPIRLGWVDMNPDNSAHIFIWSFPNAEAERAFHFFAVKLTDGLDAVANIERLYSAPDNVYVTIAPNGRWLTLYEFNGRNSDSFKLLNQETGEERVLGLTNSGLGPTWSADGNWYLMNQENHLLLAAPDYDYQKPIFHNFTNCDQAYWLEK
jgi:hypothetical protein